VTLTLTWWPSYMNSTRSPWRYIACANMNLLRQSFRKLSSDRHTDRQTYIQTNRHDPNYIPLRGWSTKIDLTRTHDNTYSVSGKKAKMFLVISSTKLRQFWWNLVYGFVNKFAAKSYKYFPPHPNNVSTLPCETWNPHHAGDTSALSDKETPEFIPPQLWPPNSPD